MTTEARIEFHEFAMGCGDLLTLEEWVSSVRAGAFIDYDGFGYYATDNRESTLQVMPSHVFRKGFSPPDWATHVMWYNR